MALVFSQFILSPISSKRRWVDKVKDDIKEKGLSVDEVYDRATVHRPPHKSGNKIKEEKKKNARHVYVSIFLDSELTKN